MSESIFIEPPAAATHWIPTRSKAVRVALVYALLSTTWIECSSWLLRHFVADPALRGFLADAKGWVFVLVTALLLALVLDRYFRKAQAALKRVQESEARLHLIGDNLPDGYVYQYTHDTDGKPRFAYISAGVEKVHGVRAVDVLQDANSLLAQMDPDDISAFLAAESQSARQLTDFELELRTRRPGGEVRLIQVRSRPRRDARGKVYWDGYAHDITDLKQAEAKVRESEAKWRSYVEYAPVGVLVAGIDGRHVEANRCAEEMLGYEPGGLLGTYAADLPSRENGQVLQNHLDELAGKGRAAGQFWLRRKDGGLIWALVRAARIEGGRMLGVFQDITEVKRAEEALRLSEAYFRAMFELASIGMAQTDPRTGQWVRVNRKMCEITGYSAEEMLGMRVSQITHPEDRDRDWDLFQRAIRGEAQDYHLEKRYLRKDGSVAWVSVNMGVIRDGAGAAVRAMATIEDITERKRTEELLRLQSAALEAAANAIIITDGKGNIEWTNNAFTAFTGYTRDEVTGKKPSVLKSGSHDATFYQNLWSTISAGKVWQSEMINRRKDGRVYNEEATITPVRDEKGEIRHFIAVKQDITQRKRAELELEQAHSRLLSVSRQAAVAEFATGILHNVGNVLNSVGVASSCLAESLKKSKTARLAQVVGLLREHEGDLCSFFANDPKGKLVPGYLSQLADKLSSEQATALHEIEELQKNVEHIKAIVTVQQDSAHGSNSSETLQFADLVEEALKMHTNAFARGEIRVIRQFDTLPPVTVQKHRILQILVNLIRNAIQAYDASVSSAKEVTVRVHRSEDRLRCAVADTGMGIAGENLERVFSFGFTTKQDGHGFGLHGALLAARDMGGTLSAESPGPGRGATFTLDLPLLPSPHSNSGS